MIDTPVRAMMVLYKCWMSEGSGKVGSYQQSVAAFRDVILEKRRDSGQAIFVPRRRIENILVG